MKILITSVLLFLLTTNTYSQKVRILNSDQTEVNFRGLSVVDDYVFWVSGSNGTIGMTPNAGKTFVWRNPDGYQDRDFRHIYASDFKTVFAIAEGLPELVLYTENAGETWDEIFLEDDSYNLLVALDVAKTPSQFEGDWALDDTDSDSFQNNISLLNSGVNIGCGMSGVGVSEDDGKNWTQISNIPFENCKKAAIGQKVYFVGPNGYIGSLLN